MGNEQRIIKFVRENLIEGADMWRLDYQLETLAKLLETLPSYDWPSVITAVCGKEETPSESE